MVSKAKRQAALEYARQSLSELFLQVADTGQFFSVHDLKVLAHLDKLEELAAPASLLYQDSPYRAHLRLLIKATLRDPAAFDALGLLAARCMDANEPMADELRRFAADVLRGRILPPTRRGAPPVHPARNAMIHGLLLDLVDRFGVTPMRNKGAPSGDSACDIVAEAMPREARLPKSYSQIEAIWLHGERMDRDAENDPADRSHPLAGT